MENEKLVDAKVSVDTKTSKAKDWLLSNIGFILIIVIFLVNTARTFLSVGLSGKSIAEIVTDGAFSLIFGWLIKTTLQEQGLLKGLASNDLIATKKAHSNTAIRIKEFRPLLKDFCDMKNAELRIQKRTQILSEKNIAYEDVFNDKPESIEEIVNKRLEAEKKRLLNVSLAKGKKISNASINKALRKEKKDIDKVIARAWKVRIIELTPSIMTSDGGKSDQPYYFGETITDYSKKKATGKLGFSFATMIIFGFLKPLFTEVNMSNLLWGALQMGTFVASGLLSFFMAYMFIIDTYRKGLIKKIDYLEEFEVGCQKGNKFIVPQEIVSTKGENDGNKQQVEQLSSNG